ncbi:MAG: hypothetical protein DWH78_13140 [Planctomycetota bacterium]|nr:MAG: hypothetical protein DWH78_13140 [Planctomycetota bacterium]
MSASALLNLGECPYPSTDVFTTTNAIRFWLMACDHRKPRTIWPGSKCRDPASNREWAKLSGSTGDIWMDARAWSRFVDADDG